MMTEKKCVHCGAILPTTAVYCDLCGARLVAPKPAATGPIVEGVPLPGLPTESEPQGIGHDSNRAATARLACPRCSLDNLATNNYCDRCGVPLH